VALQQTSDPAVYRAVLLNQIVGAPVVSLANSFNYSPNKKRFDMMKNIISSPYRKMKILLILPVFAIVLYAFAKPDYKYKYQDETSGTIVYGNSLQQNSVKGTVVQQDGKPLAAANITITGTTTGTITDANGNFRLENIPKNESLVISYVGFKSKVLKPVFTADMSITMVRDTVRYKNLNISTPPPPPPPPPVNAAGDLNAPPPPPPPPPASGIDINGDGPQPLYVVDGSITSKAEVKKLNPESIKAISVLKYQSDTINPALNEYGEKGKNGVIVITTKDKAAKDAFVVVEEMPEFPGGRDAMASWIVANLKYPAEAVKNKTTGKVLVNFMVTWAGKIKNVAVSKSVSPLLDAEAIRVISSMPEWKPARQGGKPVDVQYCVPVEFRLN
jgi:TonB family protein